MFRYAIVRPPGENFAQGLTTAGLGTPDLPLALSQHEAYCQALEGCGVELIRLPADLEHPDSTFVEDTAVLTGRSAVLARPGAPSRLGEVDGVRETIKHFYSSIYEIAAPGTLDGGDICEAGSHVFIGLSQRTNEEGARQLSQWLSADGFTSSLVEIPSASSILHLKSGIAYLGNHCLVITDIIIDKLAEREDFSGYDLIRVPAEESYSCNCVLVNDRALVPAGFPRVREELLRRGYELMPLEISEFRKMDGGLSCLSLRF